MTYRVVLQGTTAPDADVAEVKRRFMALTGLPENVTDRLFGATPRTIKSRATQEYAERMARALQKIGATATVEAEAPAFTVDNNLAANVPASVTVQTPPTYVAPEVTESTATVAPAGLSLETAYRAVVGPKNQVFYLSYFAQQDRAKSFLVSWNWAACFGWVQWALYRKLWGFALGSVALLMLVGGLGTLLWDFFAARIGGSDGSLGGIVFGTIAGMACVGALANGFYYRKVRRLVARTTSIRDPEERLAVLTRSGGTSTAWSVIGIFLVIFASRLAGTFVLPAYHDHQRGAREVSAVSANQASSTTPATSSFRNPLVENNAVITPPTPAAAVPQAVTLADRFTLICRIAGDTLDENIVVNIVVDAEKRTVATGVADRVFPAKVTDGEIVWEENVVAQGGGNGRYTINRYTGTLDGVSYGPAGFMQVAGQCVKARQRQF